MSSAIIYLDHAAATPVDERVFRAMQPYFTEKFYNPSATYTAAQAVSKDLVQARELVARQLGARPAEIIFTAGGSEANNLAIHGIMRRHPSANIVISAIEHDSVRGPATRYDMHQALVNKQGIMTVESVRQCLDDNSVLVSVIFANNEIGTIQPIKAIAALLADIRKDRKKRGINLPLYLHTDASQAANYLDVHVSRLGVDLMTLNGGKIYGPKQSGSLYVKAGVQLEPLIEGGGQEQGLRSGTEHVAAAVGFATALEVAQSMRADEVKRLQTIQHKFISLLSAAVPNVQLNGTFAKRLPNNVHATFPGCDNERVLYQLDACGILAAAGSACSASSDEPSHVLSALGLTDEQAHSSLRFTLGRSTTEADIERVVRELARLLA